MSTRRIGIFGAAILAAALVIASIGSDTRLAGVAPQPTATTTTARAVWEEVQWPFLTDQWGKGRAFRCKAASCGAEFQVFVRPKIGFCNCTTGVSDDDEIDRVGDVELIGSRFFGAAPGNAVSIVGMQGRARRYHVADGRIAKTVLAVAFAHKCDVMVATAIARDGDAPHESAVYDFLNGSIVAEWAARELGI